MNKQLIEKVIKSNNETCPNFTYENPILDKNVAAAVSKSFVKLFDVCNQNSNDNSNLRHSVLENIRRMCRTDPENHAKADENFTEMLVNVYQENYINSVATATSQSQSINKMLDAFLIRQFKGADIQSKFKSKLNPEVVQALCNLNEDGTHYQAVFDDIIHWDANDPKYKKVIQNMWDNNHLINSETVLNDISIKMKSDIEKILLENCYVCLASKCNIEIENLLKVDSSLVHLIKTSARSPDCFQICCNVLNYLFIETNFNPLVHNFILAFVNCVKSHITHTTMSTLYPTRLSHIVTLLEKDMNGITAPTNFYIIMIVTYLKSLERESDLIMLLSHFPEWFDLYFQAEESSEIKQDSI